ncbi:MAG: hypothetical protein ACR2H0_08955, partial [Candidatus Limnocylindrales bacterium]
QNLLFDHPSFPRDLLDEIYEWCRANLADERKAGEADDVFLYKTRKKALGPFKRQLWELAAKEEILASQQEKLTYLFGQLRVGGSREMVDRYIQPQRRPRSLPEALSGVNAPGAESKAALHWR